MKPMVEGVNACRCAQCGKLGRTNRPRPEFLCVRCFIVKDIGRPITKDDVRITMKEGIMIGVINERGELVGAFDRADFAEAFMTGLYAEQMAKVGCILVEYSAVPLDLAGIARLWKLEPKEAV